MHQLVLIGSWCNDGTADVGLWCRTCQVYVLESDPGENHGALDFELVASAAARHRAGGVSSSTRS